MDNLLKKKHLYKLLLVVVFFLVFNTQTYAAPNWQPNPSFCPSTDSSNFPGQNCIPINICGDNSGTAQCFNTDSLSAPATNSVSTNTSQYRTGGGYVINCNASIDSTAPFCDNNGNFWCNPDISCFGGGNNRETICIANTWSSAVGAFSCGNCLPSHLDCGGDSRCEIQKNTSAYPSGDNNHYGETCLESDAKCNASYFDCDGSGITIGNGCEQREGIACSQAGLSGTIQCTINAGGTCTNGTNNYDCICNVPKKYFETGTNTTYSTSNPLLWGQQYGSGPLIQFGNSTTNDLFILNNDGSIQIADILAPSDTTNRLYSIGGSLYWNGGIIGSSGAGIWDTDSDTGIQVEATPDDDRVRMYTAGIERFRIDEFGRMKLSSDWSSSSSALFEVGAGSEPSTFAVSADPAYLNIATFRDVDGENIFRAMGSLGGNDALVTFGDYDGAYGGAAMSIHSGSGFGYMQITEMELRFRENANLNSDYVGFRAPSTIDNSIIWTLPNTDGNIGDALITNGTGVLSWGSISSSITASNGLTLSGDEVQLGGILEKPTNIDANGNPFIISNLGYFYLADPLNNISIEHDGGGLYLSTNTGSSINLGPGLGMNFQITDDSESFTIWDLRTSTRGIEYQEDYSAGFTNRSLVDKDYVDNAVLLGSNNIYTSDGSLTGARIFDADGYNFNIVNEFISYSINSDSSGIVADDGSSRARFDIEPWFFQLYAQSQSDYSGSSIVGGNSGVLRLSANSNGGIDDALYFDLTSDSIKVISNSAIFPGITYDKDYSANFTNRSLVDKEYVDNHVTATTLQGATNNSIAQDGYVYFDTGAALFEDDGGAFKIEAQTGGYQVELASAEGSRLLFKSHNSPTNPAEIKLIDSRDLVNRHGIEYGDDYSAGFTSRSLVDKEYVDNMSFIKLSGTDVGAPITGALEFQDYTGRIINVRSGPSPDYSSYLFAEDGNFNLETHDSATNYVKSLRFGGDTTSGVTLYGNDPGFMGFMYEDDYSSNYTNRSIVDKEYVDNAISSINQHLQKNSSVLSPLDLAVYQYGITNNSANTLTGFKATNTNDVSNYAGAVLELKGSGANFTNNVYFGKYGAGFWVPSWAGNGVLATDKNLVISAVGASSNINFQIGGGYSAPVSRMTLDNNSLDILESMRLDFVTTGASAQTTSIRQAIHGNFKGFELTVPNGSGGYNPIVHFRFGGSNRGITFGDYSNTTRMRINDNNAVNLQNNKSHLDIVQTMDTALFITNTTSNPSIQLSHLYGTNSGIRLISYDDSIGAGYEQNFKIALNQSAANTFTDRFFFTHDGRLGIDTNNPDNALHVNGGITIEDVTPETTTYALYNNSGTLYWNGTQLGSSNPAITSNFISIANYNIGDIPNASIKYLRAGFSSSVINIDGDYQDGQIFIIHNEKGSNIQVEASGTNMLYDQAGNNQTQITVPNGNTASFINSGGNWHQFTGSSASGSGNDDEIAFFSGGGLSSSSSFTFSDSEFIANSDGFRVGDETSGALVFGRGTFPTNVETGLALNGSELLKLSLQNNGSTDQFNFDLLNYNSGNPLMHYYYQSNLSNFHMTNALTDAKFFDMSSFGGSTAVKIGDADGNQGQSIISLSNNILEIFGDSMNPNSAGITVNSSNFGINLTTDPGSGVPTAINIDGNGTQINMYGGSNGSHFEMLDGNQTVRIIAGTTNNTSLSLNSNNATAVLYAGTNFNSRIDIDDTTGQIIIGGDSGTMALDISNSSLDVNLRTITLGDISGDGDTVIIQDSNGICTLDPGSGASWSCSSDKQLKHDIEDLSIGLDVIMSLRPTTFKMNVDNSEQTGFIAQEVQSIMPALVSILPGGYLGVKEGGMIPYIIKAIQEQQREIETLNSGLGIFDLDELVFQGALSIDGEISLGKDTIGEITIPAGENEVEVIFDTEYKYQPIVTISKLSPSQLDDYYVTNITKNGFSIIISPSQSNDVSFSWHSFSSRDYKPNFSEVNNLEVSNDTSQDIETKNELPQQQNDYLTNEEESIDSEIETDSDMFHITDDQESNVIDSSTDPDETIVPENPSELSLETENIHQIEQQEEIEQNSTE